MSEFKQTPSKFINRIRNNLEQQTPIKIPASPFLEKIGYGTGVNVYTLERSPKVGFTRSPWAIKKRNRQLAEQETYKDRLRFEAEVIRKLNHSNIVGFRGFTEISNEPCLMMEKLDSSLGNKIEDRLETDKGPFPAEQILTIAYEMTKGLEYLHHTAHILHGDIKSYNVLVSEDYKIIKLCDFGVSLPLNESLELDTKNTKFKYVGTECWTAPEVLFDDVITNKADIWSYGLVIWEMIALSAPHVESSETDESYLTDSSFETEGNAAANQKDISMNSTSDSLDEMKNIFGKIGTRPALPAIHLGKEYEKVLEIFFACTTTEYKVRPSAKGIVQYFKNYLLKTEN